MDYRIRFENDPNATAPAQRVFIRHQLDDDLDIRTFRIGDFGFGDFTREVTNRRSILQVGFIISVTALRKCVCIYACLFGPTTYCKFQIFHIHADVYFS